MIISIMQPYLFPYIGYFQLINAVDKFVVYDDVNFIKGGWINRNYILLDSKKFLFTIPLKKASPNKLINDIFIQDNSKKLIKTIQQAYSKAPFYKQTIKLLDDIFAYNDKNLAIFTTNSLIKISDYLNIKTEFVLSSSLLNDKSKKKQEKVIEICNLLKTHTYINPIGGKDLYHKNEFNENNIELKFLTCRPVKYRQFNETFISSLSIIDVLMFNSVETINTHLMKYKLS